MTVKESSRHDAAGQVEDAERPAASGPALLCVRGPRLGRLAVHCVGVLGLVGLVVVALFFDGTAVAVFALVLGGLTVLRILQVPAGLQAVTGLALQAAAWASAFRLYEQIWWLDVLAHLVVNGLLAGAAGIALQRAGMTSTGGHRRGRWGLIITTTGAGAILAVIWEIAEWIGYEFVDPTIDVAPADTVGDLTAAVIGSAVAGIVVARESKQ